MQTARTTIALARGMLGLLLRAATLAAVFALLATSVARADYQVRYAPEDEAIYVRACFEPGRAVPLRAAHRDARDYLIFARGERDRWLSVSERRHLWVAAADQRRCIRYGVDLGSAGRGARSSRSPSFGDSFVLSSGLWLWRPNQLSDARLTIHHPRDRAVSAPWPLVSRTPDRTVYRLDGTPADWSNLTAFGALETFDISADGGVLRVSLLSGSTLDGRKMRAWLTATAEALTAVYGRLPLPSTQVLVAPLDRGRGPVPWAQVQRGGGTAVHLFINQREPLDRFLDDWTAAHEFSHLLHPYLGSRGRWLAEGLASYYQNDSRARAGQISGTAAWQKLHAGFRRGQAQTDGTSLREVSRGMRRNRQYMRVYWSGAAFALNTDVALRRDHGSSLDAVLSAFGACHLPSERIWRVEDFVAEMDRLSGARVFTTEYRRVIDSGRFPDLAESYGALGLRANGSRLRFDNGERARSLREAMMGSPREIAAECPRRTSA